MMGVHYRLDSTEGLVLGETIAVRILHQVSDIYLFRRDSLRFSALF